MNINFMICFSRNNSVYKFHEMNMKKFISFELIGWERKQIHLSSHSTIVETTITELNDGIYTYKYFVNNAISETGKLSVLK